MQQEILYEALSFFPDRKTRTAIVSLARKKDRHPEERREPAIFAASVLRGAHFHTSEQPRRTFCF